MEIEFFTDYHTHILPAMDDGPKTVEESCTMLRALYSQGVRRCVLSPHYFSNAEPIDEFLNRRSECFKNLNKQFDGENMPSLYLGAETHLIKNMARHDLKPLCINGSDILLLEFPWHDFEPWMVDEIEQIVYSQQITPMIAHVDRVMKMFSQKNLDALLGIDDFIFQINNDSLCDYFSRRQITSIFDGRLKCVLGSDSHDSVKRRPNFDSMKKCMSKSKYDGFMTAVEETSTELEKILFG